MPNISHSLPTPGQLVYQRERRLGIFFHFGINTFHDLEWSDGTLPAASFKPDALDCRQWVATARDAGASHVILTAKHHDGFCLWQTATTDYSVRQSPWKDGQGDVVAELASACREVGIKLGLYLSPWDRHDPAWANDPTDYDATYIRQLTELCTQYGTLCELWFDGAGSEQHPYDWPAIMDVVHTHQPDAMIFNMGSPTVRWVGNENGIASDPCWYVADSTAKSLYDTGRDALPDGATYLPPECDVPIRDGWFWSTTNAASLKSPAHLEAIWYRSIGLGANLLLNLSPNRSGLLDDLERERVISFGHAMQNRFADPQVAALHRVEGGFRATFPETVTIDHLWLEETLEQGQHIRTHTNRDGDSGEVIVGGVQTIGSQRVHAFAARSVGSVVIEVEDAEAGLDAVFGYHTGVEQIPALPSAAS